jgi:hypothetical protein
MLTQSVVAVVVEVLHLARKVSGCPASILTKACTADCWLTVQCQNSIRRLLINNQDNL